MPIQWWHWWKQWRANSCKQWLRHHGVSHWLLISSTARHLRSLRNPQGIHNYASDSTRALICIWVNLHPQIHILKLKYSQKEAFQPVPRRTFYLCCLAWTPGLCYVLSWKQYCQAEEHQRSPLADLKESKTSCGVLLKSKRNASILLAIWYQSPTV